MIIIAAMTFEGVIGRGNSLPWNIPEELSLFKELTEGNTVVMGRKTFESLGKPLPNRNNIVVSSSLKASRGIFVCSSLEDALCMAGRACYSHMNSDAKTFVIGGQRLYRQSLPIAESMYLSYIHKDYPGDVYFPAFSPQDWIVKERKFYAEFDWVHYDRRK